MKEISHIPLQEEYEEMKTKPPEWTKIEFGEPTIVQSRMEHVIKFVVQVLLIFLFVAAGLLLTQCSFMSEQADVFLLRALSSSEQLVVQSDNSFGLKLFRAMNEAEPDSNVIISPLSVSMALGMTLNGADGTTYDDMASTLEMAGLSEEEINEAYRFLLDLMQDLDPKVTVALANSIWYKDSFEVEPSFIEVNQDYFDAEVSALDFNAAESIDIINSWVNTKTEGKIEEIIKEISPLTVMYLINALYFKGDWIYQFDPQETNQAPFNNADQSTSTVDMMRQETRLPYLVTDDFAAVDLPYGDSLFSMTLFLPHDTAGVNDLVSQLDATSWNGWIDALTPTDILVSLPRFTVEYAQSLRDALMGLGMEVAFIDDRADFTRMNRHGKELGLHIGDVLHKTYVEVNEEGTEAAAVTAVVMDIRSAVTPSLRFDRPFIFCIRERHSGTLLFAGKVNQL